MNPSFRLMRSGDSIPIDSGLERAFIVIHAIGASR